MREILNLNYGIYEYDIIDLGGEVEWSGRVVSKKRHSILEDATITFANVQCEARFERYEAGNAAICCFLEGRIPENDRDKHPESANSKRFLNKYVDITSSNDLFLEFQNCNLFSKEVYEKELAYYEKKIDTYGTPLDSRSAFTKSDWILWCAAMTGNREQAIRLMDPIVNFLQNSESRVPFSDLYMSDTGLHRDFTARSVQGGLFMPMWKKLLQEELL